MRTTAAIGLPPHYAPVTIPELLRRRAVGQPERVAVVGAHAGAHVPLTYAELDQLSDELAAGLLRRWGLQRGASVGWVLDNRHGAAAVVLFHAVVKAGLVNVPLNSRLTVHELTEIAGHAACAALIVAEDSFGVVGERLGLDRVHVLDDGPAYGLAALLDTPVELPEAHRSDLASILYTSGTTGLPKGVEHTHESSIAAGIGWADAFRLRGSDVLQSPFPIFGGAALHFNGLSTLWAGGTFVIASADTRASWELVARWHASVYVAVPSIYQYWLADPDLPQAQLSSLRLLDYGGASMPGNVITDLSVAIPGVRLVQTYGLTEAGPGGTYLPEEYALDKLGSLGSRGAGPFTQFRVVREDGTDVEADESGELLLRGPSLMRGYHRDPEATQAVFLDGWLRSGDVVRVDAEGFLFLIDRKKDLILRGGYNISSVEIEHALSDHPDIAEVAAFGLAHPVLGETVAVAVVLRPGSDLSAEAVREHAALVLAGFKVPQHVVFLDELPRNAAGKVLKRVLAEQHG
jgi:acyl-CoA synthetase (AMP-forming)/AMP-acid ligase II